MKNFFFAALFAGVNSAEAGNHYGNYYTGPGHCHKVYKVRTYEVDRCRHKQYYTDHCGYRKYYWVVKVTYKTVYSNGTYNVWSKTFRA